MRQLVRQPEGQWYGRDYYLILDRRTDEVLGRVERSFSWWLLFPATETGFRSPGIRYETLTTAADDAYENRGTWT
jgi:hypothetical protein